MLSNSLSRWLFCGVLALLISAAVWAALGRPAYDGVPQKATWEEPAMPQSPAGRQVAGYLEAFNSGDKARLAEYVRQHFTAVGPGGSTLDDRIRSQQSLYNSSRGLNVFRVEQTSSGQVELLAQLRLTQQWRHMAFMVEAATPHRISGIRIVPAEAPDLPEQPSELPLEAALPQFLDRLVEADQFSGAVLIARGGKTTFAGAYGLADRERALPNTIDTPFHYASVGKMFTALAVGQLADEGQLAFDDALEKHLPDYPADVARRVTVDHLLSHRSGIPDYFELREQFDQVRASGDPQRDYVSVFAAEPLRFTPGERFEYSNSNYILLGAIVERLSGQTLEEYLEERVFEPAGMTATTLDPAGRGDVKPAVGYTEFGPAGTITPGERRSSRIHATGRGSAAGGGVTTVRDLAKFAEALRDRRLVSAETAAKLLTAQYDGPRPGEHYGRGFISRDSTQGRIFGHSGGFPGVDAQFDVYETGWTVVVLANYEAVGEPVARHIEKLLAAEK